MLAKLYGPGQTEERLSDNRQKTAFMETHFDKSPPFVHNHRWRDPLTL
jgi:hypothetical protein